MHRSSASGRASDDQGANTGGPLKITRPWKRTTHRKATRMTIPTEPIGSIPRPLRLDRGDRGDRRHGPELDPLYDEAIRDTIERFEATGSPVITDGEQRKYHNFWTYCVQGLPNTAPDGFKIPFSAGHTRRMPRLTGRPIPLPAARGQLPGRGPAVRPRAREAGGHLALGPEPHVPGRRDPRATPASSSSTTCCTSTRRRSAAACERARTRSRSTSRRGGWRSRSTLTAISCTASST